ncbi:ParA family protein [Achromobacter ruhlandii]|uniref:ParA family protein n=1 Tax=Achromobacter ruhlandii TaxID=72557 RepID=UPI003BA27B1F
MKVFALANQKGGVGKSTHCLQIAYYLAAKKKKKVLVVDFDSQGNSSSRILQRDEENNVIYPADKTRVIHLFDPALEEVKPAAGVFGIDLVYTFNNDSELSDIEAAALERALIPAAHMRKFLASHSYDYVIIDCPPTLGRRLIAALSFAERVVVPIKVSGFAVEGVEALLSTIVQIQEGANPDLQVAAFMINDMDSKSVVHARARDELHTSVGDLLLDNVVLHRAPIDTATSLGVPIWSLGYAHSAAKELSAMYDELMQRIGK